MAELVVKSATPADGSFWPTGATVWNAGMTPDSGQLSAQFGGTGIAALGTGVPTALGVNVGAAGAFVTFNGAMGTPSSGVATNLTGTAAGLTAGTVTTNANLTGHVTSVGNAAVLGSFTVAQLNTAISDGDVATGGGTATGTNTGDQTITLTGDVTGSGTGSFAATIANDAVTYAKIQNVTSARLLGRATAGAGDTEEITLGTNLSFTGTTLNAAGGGGATLDGITAATADQAGIANANFNIRWNWAKTTNSETAFTFGESAASTGGTSTSGVPNQVLLRASTLAASTASAFRVDVRGNFLTAASPSATQMLFANGTAAVPTIAAAAQTGSGLWFNGGGVTLSANGSQALGVGSSSNTVETFGVFKLRIGPDGTASLPSLHWNSDTFSGFFQASSNVIGVSINSTENLRFIQGGFQVNKGTADAVSYAINARKARGTVAAPTVITTGDDLLTISGYGYVGATNTYVEAATIRFDSAGAISDAVNGIGGELKFETRIAAGALAERLRVDSNATASETALLISVAGAAVQRVSIGAADSGGTGFRILRVAN